MRIAVGGDHAGFELKTLLVPWLQSAGHQVEDLGAHSFDAEDDYPDFAFLVAGSVRSGKSGESQCHVTRPPVQCQDNRKRIGANSCARQNIYKACI